MCSIQGSKRPKSSTHFVDGHAIAVVHLVKLVDAHHAAVGQHHGTSLQAALTYRPGAEKGTRFREQ